MSKCKRFREPGIGVNSEEDYRFQLHAAQCPQCREQQETDRELRRLFQGIARPGPSPDFNLVLRKRLRAEIRFQNQNRWRLHLMRGYWIAASLASAVVIMLIRWPNELPTEPAVFALGAVLGMVMLVSLALFRNLRIGPMNLILKTMDVFRQ